ncbi:MAG: hypothetical protein H6Q33_5360 [Deltaproteobacteria bacterium]|nr:hypothetical protein [Deltaproteobacteria bacterium]
MILRAALLLVSIFVADIAPAATYRVDESGSFPQQSSTQMRWRQIAPSRGGDNAVEGSMFLVLPEQPVTPVKVSWTTQGRLLPGQLVSGQRVLVYVGPIVSPVLEETLVLKMEADGTRLSSAQRLQFHFEIDID